MVTLKHLHHDQAERGHDWQVGGARGGREDKPSYHPQLLIQWQESYRNTHCTQPIHAAFQIPNAELVPATLEEFCQRRLQHNLWADCSFAPHKKTHKQNVWKNRMQDTYKPTVCNVLRTSSKNEFRFEEQMKSGHSNCALARTHCSFCFTCFRNC